MACTTVDRVSLEVVSMNFFMRLFVLFLNTEEEATNLVASCFYWRQSARAARDGSPEEEMSYSSLSRGHRLRVKDQVEVLNSLMSDVEARACAEAWLISHPEWVEGDSLEVFAFGEFADGARPSVTLRPVCSVTPPRSVG